MKIFPSPNIAQIVILSSARGIIIFFHQIIIALLDAQDEWSAPEGSFHCPQLSPGNVEREVPERKELLLL